MNHDRDGHRSPDGMRHAAALALALLVLLLGSGSAAAAPTTSTAPAWRPPDPIALKDQEIRLLKQELAQTRLKLDDERVGRIVFETQLRVAALHAFGVHDVVKYEPLTAAVIEELIDESIRKEYPGKSLEHYVWLNQLFAALPEPFDMKTTVRDLMGEQAGGIYDPHRKTLYVKTDFPLETPLGQLILSHEICHAFQDQNFTLTDLGVESAENSDHALAALSLAEGDATLLMAEYFAKHGNPLQMLRALPSMLSMDQQKLNEAPPALQETLLFPYLQGMKFFNGLRGRTRKHPRGSAEYPEPGWRNEVFQEPPATTQQILHPDLYLSGKLPEAVAVPKFANAVTTTVNVAGEFGTRLLLQPMLGVERASRAAEGWNGDRLGVADLAGGRRQVRWSTRWDSADEAGEFAAALEEALTARFAGKLPWKDDKQGRVAGDGTVRFRIARPSPGRVELRGELPAGQGFPKVQIKRSPLPLPGF